MKLFKRAAQDYYGVEIITGPNSLLLYLRFGTEAARVDVEQVPHPRCPPIDAERVRAAVESGVAEANAACGTNLRPIAIRYRIEYFSEGLLAQGAWLIIEQYAVNGNAGFTPVGAARTDIRDSR